MTDLEKVVDDFMFLLNYMRQSYLRPAEQITRLKLSHAQFHAISILALKGPLPMTELANKMTISKQQLTPLIYKLIEAGWVVRKTDENDRRIVLIDVTEEGLKTYNDLKAEIKHKFIEKLSELPENELEELDDMLQKIQMLLKGVT